jgi:hypothetical protein
VVVYCETVSRLGVGNLINEWLLYASDVILVASYLPDPEVVLMHYAIYFLFLQETTNLSLCLIKQVQNRGFLGHAYRNSTLDVGL